MADTGRGDDLEEALEKAVSGAKNGDTDELLALDHRRLHGAERRLDVDQRGRHVARDLVGHQRADLAQQHSERARARVLLSHERELVLHQRMIDDVELGHGRGDFHGSPP